ncbi:MAG: winged helix-turn-helix domain-containing protein [Pseudomonadota bacterium]
MREGPDISQLAALIGDPARANILTALMTGQALTPSELAEEAGVSLPMTSQHLSKLVDGGFLVSRKQGRHKYISLANAQVADVLEALMGLAEAQGLQRVRPGPKDAKLREARVCYNHLAGARGVQLYSAMVDRGWLTVAEQGLGLTEAGRRFVRDFGIDLGALEGKRAPICRECLDWSERRSHLSGSLGRALLTRMEDLGWLQRETDSRAILFSITGLSAFNQAFSR